jgi:hypothetical protein
MTGSNKDEKVAPNGIPIRLDSSGGFIEMRQMICSRMSEIYRTRAVNHFVTFWQHFESLEGCKIRRILLVQ